MFIFCELVIYTQRLVRSSGFLLHAAKTVTTLEQQLRDSIMISRFCRFGRTNAVSFSRYDAVAVPITFFIESRFHKLTPPLRTSLQLEISRHCSAYISLQEY